MKTKRLGAIEEFEQEMLEWLEHNGPAPMAEIVPGPWPRRLLTEQELINRQQQIDYWWGRHLEEVADRNRERTSEEKLSDEIWGRSR